MIIDTDDLSASELLEALTKVAMEVHARDRDKFAAVIPLSPPSLVGSFFRAPHEEDDVVDEGLVVGQPFATSTTTMYLVEFFGRDGALGNQQLKTIDEMLVNKWSFYDSEAWLSMSGEPAGKVRERERESESMEQKPQ